MQVKIFRDLDIEKLEKEINEFIKDKCIIDIKFSTDAFYNKHLKGVPVSVAESVTAMIMYTDEKQQFQDSRKKHAIL